MTVAAQTASRQDAKILSLICTVLFFLRYRDPKEMNREGKLSDAELAHILDGGAQHEDAPKPDPLANLGYILRQRKVWGMSLGLGCAGYVQWMLLTWLPGFLQAEMDMDDARSGLVGVLLDETAGGNPDGSAQAKPPLGGTDSIGVA